MTGAWPARLSSGGVLLRPLARSDRAAFDGVRARNREWLGPWNGTSPSGSRQPRSFAQMHRELTKAARKGLGMPFVIEVDGNFAGQVSVFNVVLGSGRFASIGYWIDEAYAGRGVMTRAVAMTIDHCFFVAGLHRIEIAIRPENEKSLRVVQKLGLTEFGFAERFLHIDGDWRDHRLFAVNAEDVPDGLVAGLPPLKPPRSASGTNRP